MEKLVVEGRQTVQGQTEICGAKNAILPILAGSILNPTKDEIFLTGVPELNDVAAMLSILRVLGVESIQKGDRLCLRSDKVENWYIPDHLMKEMRSSVILMGALLGRLGRAKACNPGGCAIGLRPIDLHLKGFQAMGIKLREKDGYIEAYGAPAGAQIHLDYPSVGATENLMLIAVLAKGTTVIKNAAREPEIADLQQFLNTLGAQVVGAGTETIRINGVESLSGGSYRVIPDRIITGSYMIAAAATGGEILLTRAVPEHLEAVSAKLREAGVEVVTGDSYIWVRGNTLRAVEKLHTLPYPGFPTDLQAPMVALLSMARGTSTVVENIFENRFRHVDELNKMGANISVSGRTLVIKGVNGLTGAEVEATDLRAGMALIITGLAARGQTVIHGVHHLDRGYPKIEDELGRLGVYIERQNVPDYRRIQTGDT